MLDYSDPRRRPLIETDSAGTPLRYFIWAGGSLLAIQESNGVMRYAHSDEQGHIVALTDTNGAVTDQFAYGPYGENWGRLGTTYLPFQWLGDHGVWTLPNGLCLTQHRVYDKTLRRFTSSDPAGLAGGNNLYAYTDGNPINEIDPSGLCAEVGGRTYSVKVTPLRDAKMDAHLQDVLLRQKLARDNPEFYHFKYGYDASDAAQLVANIIFTAVSMVTPFPDELLAAPAMARTGRALGALSRKPSVGTVNLDAGVITDLAARSRLNPVVRSIRHAIGGREMLATRTALHESIGHLRAGNASALQRWRWLHNYKSIKRINADPSEAFNISPSRRLKSEDLKIFGTGHKLGIPTLTTDAEFPRVFNNRFNISLDYMLFPPLRY